MELVETKLLGISGDEVNLELVGTQLLSGDKVNLEIVGTKLLVINRETVTWN